MKAGERFEAGVEALAFGGDGVAHAPDGITVFVPFSAPGDRVEARIDDPHKTYARASITRLLSPGPGRAEPPCPAFGACGGCQWQHLDYPSQLRAKEQFVRESLRRIGGLGDARILPIIPSPQPYAYRNKAAVPAEGGFGYYRHGSHEIVALPEAGCAIQSPASNAALNFARAKLAGLSGVKHVAVRGNSRGESLIALVSAAPLTLDAEAWLKELPGLKGVVNNLQPKPGNAIFGGETRVLSGKSFLIEELDGLKFRLSATSFFQVNSHQAVALWKLLLSSRAWKPGEQVLELYSGVGTLSLPMARYGLDVLAVESWAGAVDDAKQNAALNGISGARFECADAALGFGFRPDPAVLVLDPPRKGLEPAALKAVLAAAPKEILYISCDPASLSRDLKALTASGWKNDFIQPLDMFPQTFHVECLAKLAR